MTRLLPVLNILSFIIASFALAMLAPLGVSLIYADGARSAFEQAFLITFASGAALWLATGRHRTELQPRDGFLLVALVWT
ncbi:MAG: TrkH family potassium uptake protein, partial [Betaproteobacteria bacterium]|nr:TrkH family potassium uptake protein [Betaproteobacteria bacterium]